MRKFLTITAALAGLVAATAVIGTAAKAQPYYGGMMGGYGYGPGYGYGMGPGMMDGYGPGYGRMGRGYGPGYMMGPGYGYGRGYGDQYRGKRLCWQTDADGDEGHYAPCQK